MCLIYYTETDLLCYNDKNYYNIIELSIYHTTATSLF